MRESNTHAINVTQNVLSKVISRDINFKFLRESNTYAINVTIKLVEEITSRNI